MRSYYLVIFMLVTFSHSFGQNYDEIEIGDISKADSVLLDNTFDQFINAIKSKNTERIKELSLKKIDCDLCVAIRHSYKPTKDYIIPIDTFINQAFEIFADSPLALAIKKRGYKPTLRIIKDYKPRNLPKEYPKNLSLYELWVETYLPDEWAKGHEGQSHGFQFVKLNNQFKFYGLTSVP